MQLCEAKLINIQATAGPESNSQNQKVFTNYRIHSLSRLRRAYSALAW